MTSMFRIQNARWHWEQSSRRNRKFHFHPMKSFRLLAVLLWIAPTSGISAAGKADAISLIRKVNDHWQANHPEHGNSFWNRAVYHVGNMDAYSVTGETAYRKYSERWSERNHWKGATSDKKNEWRYSYGEKPEYVLFGDWQVFFGHFDWHSSVHAHWVLVRALRIQPCAPFSAGVRDTLTRRLTREGLEAEAV